jgi:hypothetical protein
MRRLFSTVVVFLLSGALVGQAQPSKGGGKGRGGFAPKNLKVLDPTNLPNAMQSYVEALGLLDKGVCRYCHVEDRASDEKMQKGSPAI